MKRADVVSVPNKREIRIVFWGGEIEYVDDGVLSASDYKS
jgi:hypothetical protein